MNQLIISTILTVFLSTPLFAAESKATPPAKGDEMRCEKVIATTLADFKSSLVENCNLNKPFSASLSKVLSDEVYFYCCHKR